MNVSLNHYRILIFCLAIGLYNKMEPGGKMHITDVQIFIANEDKLKAYATITIENAFIVRDLKVIQGTTGLFVAMPAKKRKDGTFKDIAHPLNQETRAQIEEKVFAAYHLAVASGDKPSID